MSYKNFLAQDREYHGRKPLTGETGCPFGVCPFNKNCVLINTCMAAEVEHAGYEIHKKNQVEQVEEGSSVATHLRQRDLAGQVESSSNSDGERGNQEGVLTLEEVRKLRKHMALWPG